MPYQKEKEELINPFNSCSKSKKHIQALDPINKALHKNQVHGGVAARSRSPSLTIHYKYISIFIYLLCIIHLDLMQEQNKTRIPWTRLIFMK